MLRRLLCMAIDTCHPFRHTSLPSPHTRSIPVLRLCGLRCVWGYAELRRGNSHSVSSYIYIYIVHTNTLNPTLEQLRNTRTHGTGHKLTTDASRGIMRLTRVCRQKRVHNTTQHNVCESHAERISSTGANPLEEEQEERTDRHRQTPRKGCGVSVVVVDAVDVVVVVARRMGGYWQTTRPTSQHTEQERDRER